MTLGTANLLQSFDDFRVILADDDKDIEWTRLKRRFEENLTPAEERVTEKLKKHLANANSAVLLVGEFQKYTELLKRENIKQNLRGERETLLAAFDDLIDAYQAGPDTENLLDIPQILQEVQAARTAEIRLELLQKLSKELLDDLPGYKDALLKVNTAMKNAEAKRNNLVDTWVI